MVQMNYPLGMASAYGHASANFHEARIQFLIMKKRNVALPQNFSI
jgi:hypothetical protein